MTSEVTVSGAVAAVMWAGVVVDATEYGWMGSSADVGDADGPTVVACVSSDDL